MEVKGSVNWRPRGACVVRGQARLGGISARAAGISLFTPQCLSGEGEHPQARPSSAAGGVLGGRPAWAPPGQ